MIHWSSFKMFKRIKKFGPFLKGLPWAYSLALESVDADIKFFPCSVNLSLGFPKQSRFIFEEMEQIGN